MIPSFAQCVALLGSLLLALPPGWCSGVFTLAADEGHAPHACCRQAAEQEPPSHPAESSVDCCCDRDVVLAKMFELPEPVAVVLWTADDAVSIRPAASRESVISPDALVSSMRPHVLQCVWLC